MGNFTVELKKDKTITARIGYNDEFDFFFRLSELYLNTL